MFYFDKISNLEILKSSLLGNFNIFFTTRNSVIKTKEDDLSKIAEKNLETIKLTLGLDKIISPKQTHTTNVEIASFDKTLYQDVDALILKDKKIGIFLNFADCVPVILYDIKNNIGAIAHAGWRGCKGKIAQKTFFKMQNEFNSKQENIIALIGPSICYNCFETSYEIAKSLEATVLNKEGVIKFAGGKSYADLKEINLRQLKDINVTNVDKTSFCTCCNNDKFFSYRKENKTTNRISAFISLK